MEIHQSTISNTISVNIVPIKTLYEENPQLGKIIGYVKKLESIRSFIRNDGSTGNMQRFILVDQSGCISCVAWNLIGSNELKNDIFVAIQHATLKKRRMILSFNSQTVQKYGLLLSFLMSVRGLLSKINIISG